LNRKDGKKIEQVSIKEPEIKIPFPAYLSEEYIPDVHQRLSIYRRFSGARDDNEIISLEEELKDRYGTLPDEAQNFIWLIRIKQSLKKYRIEALTVGPERISLMMGMKSATDPDRIIHMISQKPTQFQLTPDSKLVVNSPCTSLKEVNFALEALLEQIRAA
jgi:transcription-repair coupling factor (superfamily II helicase)